MNDFQKLIHFENLYKSYKVSMRGNGSKRSAANFDAMALEHIYVMKKQLLHHTYQIAPYSEFVVSEPKRRVIKSGSFRDKVLQHCLCDYVLLPKMEPVFITDNYAGQIGKGTLFGLNRLTEKLKDFYNNYGNSGYILKCDIAHFFYSIDHQKMKECLRKYIDNKDILWVCDLFVDSTNGCGLPLGNQCSQVFALMFLNAMDHMITEELGCDYYGRYMDDFYLLSADKEYLTHCLFRIQEHLESLGLSLNSKTQIVPMRRGIRFLGFHIYLTENGNVIRKLTGDNKRQIKRRLRKNAKLVQEGRMTLENFYERYNAWKNHASHGHCYNLIYSMDSFVENLMQKEGI